jgi:hypothetical protein
MRAASGAVADGWQQRWAALVKKVLVELLLTVLLDSWQLSSSRGVSCGCAVVEAPTRKQHCVGHNATCPLTCELEQVLSVHCVC